MKSWVRLRVEGLNLDRQLDRAVKSGVFVREVTRPQRKVMEFCVLSKQKNNALAFFPHECYNTTVISLGGVGAVWSFVKKQPALILCFALLFCCLFWLDGFIWRVEIFSDDGAAVEEALRQNNLWIGSPKSSFSPDGVENMLCNALPNVNYAIVKTEGCTLFVTTHKKDEAAQTIDLSKPRDVFASCDGVITRMTVVNGTARVAVGDAVKKGQVLIEGVRTFGDGSTEPVCAVGEVFAQVTAQGQHKFQSVSSRLVKTGKSTTIVSVKFLGFESKTNHGVYPRQIVETSTEKTFPLPIEIAIAKVFEAREVKETLDFADYRDKCRQIALEQALTALGSESRDVRYSEEKNGLDVLVTAYVTAERRVDTYAK